MMISAVFVISNRTRGARSFDFEITRMISDQIALHPVQLPLLILDLGTMFSTRIVTVHACLHNNKLF